MEYDYVREKFIAIQAQQLTKTLLHNRASKEDLPQCYVLRLRSICAEVIEDTWDAAANYVQTHPKACEERAAELAQIL